MTGPRRQRKTARSRPNRRQSPIGASAPQEGHIPVVEIGALAGGRSSWSSTSIRRMRALFAAGGPKGDQTGDHAAERLTEIVDLLHTKASHDFTLYKPGMLLRRIERRMALVGITDSGRYLDLLRKNAGELELLAKDLLINVTSFFRDPEIFELLAEKIIPDLVRLQPSDRPLRIWVAGCSTGEEAYTLAMLFLEEIAAAKRTIKLQVLASDVDAGALAIARKGAYPESIAAAVSPIRLARFFAKEEHGYRVVPELLGVVVFTVQNVLADPPFSRLDLVSCRNLLIYLRPDAQAKVLSFFHFALRKGGILLLGGSETAGNLDDRFEPIFKTQRIYRRPGHSEPGEIAFPFAGQWGTPALQLPGLGQAARHRPGLGDLSRLLLEAYAPASVLINRKYECLYYLGATDGYLRAVSGEPSRDLLALAREGLRNKLRAAIQRASEEGKRAVVAGGQIEVGGNTVSVSIAVQPVQNQGEEFLLVSFLGKPKSGQRSVRYAASADAVEVARIEELKRELDVTRKELQRAIHDLQISSEEQMAIDEEAQSVNEEFLSTNEELTTSREELQSLNEELTALNSQLHETLERQRSTSDDLQNILYSSGVATIFLDRDLKIRFFTSAARSLFPVIASDIGRPLADLKSLSADTDLLADARLVLANLTPMKHEIEARDGAWYNRRILPYHTEDNRVEGVVITFADVSEIKAAERKIRAARAYSNSIIDTIRQPLVVLDEELRVVSANRSFHDTFALEPAETGQPLGDTGDDHFDIRGLRGFLDRVRAEPAPIEGREIEFDLPRLGRRALLLNARKIRDASSGKGKVLLAIEDVTERKRAAEVVEAAKRHAERANIAKARFLDAASHDLRRPLQTISLLQGLLANNIKDEGALKLVARLDETLSAAAGMLNTLLDINELEAGIVRAEPQAKEGAHRASAILVVEDEPAVREMLKLLLDGEGHRTACAADGRKALELVARRAIQPDLVVVDYNLPNGMSGLQVIAGLQKMLHDEIPAIILTGEISTDALREIVHQGCLRLNKPVKAKDLTHLVQQLLAKPRPAPDVTAPQQVDATGGAQPETIFVVDDDSSLRDAMRELLQAEGWRVESYASGEAFFEAYHSGVNSCLLVDAGMPGMSGLDVLQRLKTEGHRLAAIMITGGGDVPMAVQAMKAGAADFIEKPIGREELLASIERALELTRDSAELSVRREAAASRLGSLTIRQRQVMDLVLAGHPSKNIAADLGVGQRTIETHRRAIMKKTGSKSLPALVRLALAAT